MYLYIYKVVRYIWLSESAQHTAIFVIDIDFQSNLSVETKVNRVEILYELALLDRKRVHMRWHQSRNTETIAYTMQKGLVRVVGVSV